MSDGLRMDHGTALMPDPLAGLPPRFLRTPEAARFLSLSGRTLEKHRIYGTGPQYRKIGGRVVYALDEGVGEPRRQELNLRARRRNGAAGQAPDRARCLCGQGAALMFAPDEDASGLRRRASGPEPLDLFRALPGDLAPRDAQDLMAYPFFSLAKSKRLAPIDFRAGAITIRVEAVPEHGMATIWDADVLIWAASQIVNARDAGLRTSRLMTATPYEILTFVGRGASARDYQRLKAGLDRLQSTTVATSIRQAAERRRHRFSWINEWKERADANGRALGVELILPDWFYAGVLDDALVLTIDRAYFSLTGGLERWLYRVVRKHGGRQEYGWSFDFAYLHAKSGSLSPLKHFAYDIRDIVRRQPLPGYSLAIERALSGTERLSFKPSPTDLLTEGSRHCQHVRRAVDNL
jgi:plasmid replication initiation protein